MALYEQYIDAKLLYKPHDVTIIKHNKKKALCYNNRTVLYE